MEVRRSLMTKKIIMIGSLLVILAVGLLMNGCSRTGPTEPGTIDSAPQAQTSKSAPVFVPIGNNRQTDGSLPGSNLLSGVNFVFDFMTKELGGQLWLDGHGIVIAPNGLPYDTRIALAVPYPGEAVVDFEPHGLVFTSPQYARISYTGCELPPGISANDLAVWYYNEVSGEYECIGGNNNLLGQYIEFSIEHFSRYIVAGQQ